MRVVNMDQFYKPINTNGIITTLESKHRLECKGAGHTFFSYMKKYSNKIFQVDAHTDEEDTYATVLLKSIRVALQMRERGVKPNDLILVCTVNQLNNTIPVFAALFIGAQVTFLDQRININEAILLMEQVDPNFIFVGLEAVIFIEDVLSRSKKTASIITFGKSSLYTNFYDLLTPCVGEEDFTPLEVNDTETAFVFFSSGSTGLPKGISLSHRAFLGQVQVFIDLEEPFERTFLFTNIYWSTHMIYLGAVLTLGYCRICTNFSNDLQVNWKAITTHKPTYLLVTPFMIRKLAASITRNTNVESFRKIYIGGSQIFDHELIQFRKIFSQSIVVRGYGMTEVGVTLYFPTHKEEFLKYLDLKLKSVGYVLNGISYKVIDVDTEQIVGPFQHGELRVKTESALSGYYKKDSSDAFDSDGWFKTGDLVYYDEDFFFYFVERLKGVIKYRNWPVLPKMIENVLTLRDDIKYACVIGIPHDLDGEHPMAIIVLEDNHNASDSLKQDIAQYVEQQFGNNYKLRGGIEIVDEIPISTTGKYDARKLRSMFT